MQCLRRLPQASTVQLGLILALALKQIIEIIPLPLDLPLELGLYLAPLLLVLRLYRFDKGLLFSLKRGPKVTCPTGLSHCVEGRGLG